MCTGSMININVNIGREIVRERIPKSAESSLSVGWDGTKIRNSNTQ
jgi:hypothetical protein